MKGKETVFYAWSDYFPLPFIGANLVKIKSQTFHQLTIIVAFRVVGKRCLRY